jgi:hypothetical protein
MDVAEGNYLHRCGRACAPTVTIAFFIDRRTRWHPSAGITSHASLIAHVRDESGGVPDALLRRERKR